METAFAWGLQAKAPKGWKEATSLLADPALDVLLQARQKCHAAAGKWTEERENCVETKQIDRVTWEGKIVYRVECKALPPVKHKDPLPPVTLPKASASGLKKGDVVIVVGDGDKSVLVSDFPGKKAAEADSNLGVFLGVKLKP